MQFLPLMAYFGVSQLVKQGAFEGVLPPQVIAWLPMVAGFIAFVISTRMQQAQADAANAKLVGKDAPDFEITLMDKTQTTLRKLISESGLPTVVDFYADY
eukprot:TRINITY_DN54752_c0_g1_i1.p2 TRINITY_DN54752_c0_g1~~TRINITY_DN54752_c0_g1_i1.p2  ORF type:complete len:100 (-),score=37.70 TRINITY_DN54752_c0_g1_i1:515-814(-)